MKHTFVLDLYSTFGTISLPTKPQDCQEGSKDDAREPPRAIPNSLLFLASLAQKIRPKINHQSDQEIVQSLAQKTTTKWPESNEKKNPKKKEK